MLAFQTWALSGRMMRQQRNRCGETNIKGEEPSNSLQLKVGLVSVFGCGNLKIIYRKNKIHQ